METIWNYTHYFHIINCDEWCLYFITSMIIYIWLVLISSLYLALHPPPRFRPRRFAATWDTPRRCAVELGSKDHDPWHGSPAPSNPHQKRGKTWKKWISKAWHLVLPCFAYVPRSEELANTRVTLVTVHVPGEDVLSVQLACHDVKKYGVEYPDSAKKRGVTG